jgi:hypothetical protein
VDDRHAIRVGVIELDELTTFFGRVGDQLVRKADDLFLAIDPADRLGRVAFGELGVLDLGHGVHRVDQRHTPPLTGDGADLARQPVVRVHQVEVPRFALNLCAQDIAYEGAQLRGKVVLLQALERSSGDMVHADPRLGVGDRFLVAGGRAGEYLHLDAPRGELSRKLEHVHVHTARVAVSRLIERGCVCRQHRDALEHEHPPSSSMMTVQANAVAACPSATMAQ